jgi:hypothetical protein
MKTKLRLVGALATTLVIAAIAAGTVASLAGGLNPKQLFTQKIDQHRAAAAQAVSPKQKSGPRLPAPTSEKATRLAGIEDIQQGPVPASEFLVTNQWSGPESPGSNEWWQVYAGAKGQTIPAVYVETSIPTADGYSFQTSVVGIFSAPNADSALRITAANGAVLDLVTQTGRVFHFNLAIDRYQ